MNYLFHQRKSLTVSSEAVATHLEIFTKHVIRGSRKTSSKRHVFQFLPPIEVLWTKNFRRSCPEVFLGKGVLKICSKYAGEHSRRNAISIKLLCNFIKITLRHGCSPVNLLRIFITPFSKKTSGRLLLKLKPGVGYIKIQKTNYCCQLKCTKRNPCLVTWTPFRPVDRGARGATVPRLLLKLTFYQLIMAVKIKKVAKKHKPF